MTHWVTSPDRDGLAHMIPNYPKDAAPWETRTATTLCGCTANYIEVQCTGLAVCEPCWEIASTPC
jgi:hypothetical protein